jgi:hypothetical protein
MSTPATTPELQISLAGPEDEPELRRLLRENPVPGVVSISYEREPDFFLASGIEGGPNQTLVALEGSKVVALGTRSLHTACVNGEATRIGTLSQLRLDRSVRGNSRLLFRGYEKLKELHDEDGETAFYLSTLIEGNEPARRFLTSGHPRLPRYHFLESFRTLVLDAHKVDPIAGRPGRAEDLPMIAGCLQRQAGRTQLCRPWMTEDLLSPQRSRGLSPEDFQIAFSGSRMAGCLALWDQSAFKQAVVRGYSGSLRMLRALAGLPKPGQPLRMATLSHMAVDGDDSQVLLSLIRGAAAQARDRGIRHLVLGLSTRNPLLDPVRQAFAPREYGSTLYAVHWEDGADAVQALDSRPCHVEVATL